MWEVARKKRSKRITMGKIMEKVRKGKKLTRREREYLKRRR